MTGFFLPRIESLTWGITKTKLWWNPCGLFFFNLPVPTVFMLKIIAQSVSAFQYGNRNMFSISISYFPSKYVYTLIVFKYYEHIFSHSYSFFSFNLFFIFSLSHYISFFSLSLPTFSPFFCFQLCLFLAFFYA